MSAIALLPDGGSTLAGRALGSDGGGPVLIGGHCKDCDVRTFPAFKVCPSCMSENIVEEHMPKSGLLYAFSKVHVGPAKWQKPFTVGYVDLDNGVRVFSHLRGPLQIGQRVTLKVGEVGGSAEAPLSTFVFEPAE